MQSQNLMTEYRRAAYDVIIFKLHGRFTPCQPPLLIPKHLTPSLFSVSVNILPVNVSLGGIEVRTPVVDVMIRRVITDNRLNRHFTRVHKGHITKVIGLQAHMHACVHSRVIKGRPCVHA